MTTAANLYGNDLFGDAIAPAVRCTLSERFGQPPFSVLSAREGDWQERKRAWIALGIRSELGRGEELITAGKNAASGGNGFSGNRSGARASAIDSDPLKRYGVDRNGSRANAALGGSAIPAMDYQTGERGRGNGRRLGANMNQGLMRGEGKMNAVDELVDAAVHGDLPPSDGYRADAPANSTSIFDPVLCELMYSWFTCSGAQIVDPFAGGSVRGIVAGVLGRRYWGCDLSERQVIANREQAAIICADNLPYWHVGDSIVELPQAPFADFVFSCPPYGDLEVYSDDPKDLSTMTPEYFNMAYRAIIQSAVSRLKPDRFACFVVGDYRDKAGFYHNFPAKTIDHFQSAGAKLYNEAILLTAVGSLPVRITTQFEANRKLGKAHQNILIFCKGDPKKAAAFAKGGE